jgi:hypothetical protein
MKQTRQERAESLLIDSWHETKRKRSRGGYSAKGAKRRQKEYDAAFERLIQIAHRYGIRIWIMSEAEREMVYKARDGHEFKAGGVFIAPATIKLRYRSLETLAHELGHALDYQLGEGYIGSETIAVSVSTIVCGVLAGTYQANCSYARSQGGGIPTAHEQERIDLIVESILEF